MNFSEEDDIFAGLGGGCPIHGDEAMIECSVCGAEFCARCHPRTELCPECASLPEDELLEDVEDEGKETEEEDEEAERLLKEADLLPVADLDEAKDEEVGPLFPEAEEVSQESDSEAIKKRARKAPSAGKRKKPAWDRNKKTAQAPVARARKATDRPKPAMSSGKSTASRGGKEKGRRPR